MTAAREVLCIEDVYSSSYLSRWLASSHWDAAAAFKCLVNHASWRTYNIPNGCIDEVNRLWSFECTASPHHAVLCTLPDTPMVHETVYPDPPMVHN